MRIALVSPYSWSYPGGVSRHVEALAEQFGSDGHDVRVLAPLDPPGRITTRLHWGRYDVVHIHEAVAPAIGWFAADRVRRPVPAVSPALVHQRAA